MTAEGRREVVKNFCSLLDMAEKVARRLRDVVDLLESAVEEKDWGLVEEALDELRSIVDELEE
jgi:hypothetical protein